MPLRVSGKNLDVGESLRGHVLEKVETMVARYFDGRVSGHVVISREGSGYRSDCSLHLSSGVDLHAEGKAQEPYPSVEQGLDKIERRLRRYKTRLRESRAPSVDDQQATMEVSDYKIEAPDETAEIVEDFKPAIVAEGSRRLCGRRTRSQRRPVPGVPTCWQRTRERHLPARRRRDRLARSALMRSTTFPSQRSRWH
jgi:ribosomal subunit interface protein